MRFMKIRLDDNETLTVSFTYERLPNFFYLCGRLRHLSKFCSKRYESDFVDPGDDTPYGAWLQATPIFRSPARNQNSMRSSSDFINKESSSGLAKIVQRSGNQRMRRGAEIFNPSQIRNVTIHQPRDEDEIIPTELIGDSDNPINLAAGNEEPTMASTPNLHFTSTVQENPATESLMEPIRLSSMPTNQPELITLTTPHAF
ncbi:UNVERIFIED_CONTAM: hypothetical protein Slati_4255200 [Sesamum latifolium]|uniref:Zinc knuckle CX2CX4HX4C domain-containing protein n=1 Tax=Sesamum latifolium TaxID=2727402 RepID=A0AAW2TBS5_9LAMI